VHNIDRINVSNRKNVIIDEDTTLDYFYPPSPAIARIKSVVNHLDVRNYLNDTMKYIDKLTEVIGSKQHKMKRDKELLQVFQKIKDINDALLDARTKQHPADEISDKIKAIVLQGYQEKSEDEILDILTSLDGYYHPTPAQEDDVVDLREVVTAVLHPYKERAVHLINSGRGYQTMYLIGDAHNPLINNDWISSSHKIVIIGATKAEYFARRIKDEPIVVEVGKFKYARNFVVIPINHDDQKNKKNKYRRQQKKLRKTVKLISGTADSTIDRPVIVFAGSKNEQLMLENDFKEKAHRAQNGGKIAHIKNFKAGNINICYLNSIISRGLDVDQYGLIAVHGSNFAQPFWSAAKYAGEEEAEEILNSIVADETINCALRISPTERSGRTKRPKIVLIPEGDLWKIERYLQSQVVDVKKANGEPLSAAAIAKTIMDQNFTGRIITTEDINKPNELDNRLAEGWENAVEEGRLTDLLREKLMDNIDADEIDLNDRYFQDSKIKVLQLFNVRKDTAIRLGKKFVGLHFKELKNSISPAIKHSVLRRCLNELLYEKKVKRHRIANTDYYHI